MSKKIRLLKVPPLIEGRLLKVPPLIEGSMYELGDILNVEDSYATVILNDKYGHFFGFNVDTLVNEGIAEWVDDAPGWDEVSKKLTSAYHFDVQDKDDKISRKLRATYKLYHIMKHEAYNGDWEPVWADSSQKKYVIFCVENILVDKWCYASREFIAFKTREIREKFKSNESNMKLVHDYFMLEYKD